MRLRSPAKELPINTGKLGVGMSYADTKTLDDLIGIVEPVWAITGT